MTSHVHPQPFFQGRAKFSRGAGGGVRQKHTIPKKLLFFSKKEKKHTILPDQGGQEPRTLGTMFDFPIVMLLHRKADA